MNGFLQDIRYALRQMRKKPGFTAAAIVVLALGIGATTGMLGVVQSVLIRPLGYKAPDQLVLVGITKEATSTSDIGLRNFQEMQRNLHGFAEIGAYSSLPVAVKANAGTQMLVAPQVSPNFLEMLGVQPMMGRSFREGDDAPGANVAVVSQPFWQHSLHGDKDVLGSKIKVGGELYTIVGVMPPHFQFPLQTETLWTAWQLSGGKTKQGISQFSVLARLKPGATLEQAQSEGEAFVHHTKIDGNSGQPTHFWVYPYKELVTGDEKPALLALLSACFLLLLIAVVNTANLQIARATHREAEISMRSALGATRARLLRQLITENLLLCFAGSALGWLVAMGFVQMARQLFQNYVRVDEAHLDFWTFFGCMLLTCICGVVTGLAPARHLLRKKSGGAFQGAGSRHYSRPQRLSGVLVAAEVALTCVLLVAAGLFLKTFRSLENVPLGFDPDHVTTFLLWPQGSNTSASAASYQRILDRLQHLPNVAAAGLVTSLPVSHFQLWFNAGFSIPGYLAPVQKNGPEVRLKAASPGYFSALEIPLLSGRFISDADAQGSQVVGVVNHAFATQVMHGKNPIGEEIVLDKGVGFSSPITIVGVSGDVIQGNAIGPSVKPEVVVSYQQIPPSSMPGQFLVGLAASFAVRSSSATQGIAQDIRTVLKTEAPDFAVDGLTPMNEAVQDVLRTRRLAVEITSIFGWLALLLSATGLYGVLAYLVGQRIREIGIRLALGATKQNIFALVAKQGLLMVGAGLLIGWVGAWFAGRWIRSFLFGTTTHDLFTYALVGVVVVLASAIAVSLPARRAAKVDPMVALRYE